MLKKKKGKVQMSMYGMILLIKKKNPVYAQKISGKFHKKMLTVVNAGKCY